MQDNIDKKEKLNDLPALFHIGTQKAGSTYLYNLLSAHPNIALSELTEVNFFSSLYGDGITWYNNHFLRKGSKIDTSPKYFMFGKDVAPRIKAYSEKYLESKPLFLLILRNPIDYLNSHFQMHISQNFFKKNYKKYQKFSADIVEFTKIYPEYLERAYYYKILKEYWLPHFNLDQFRIIFFEELVANPSGCVKEILTFWNLPPTELKADNVSRNTMLKYKFIFKLQNKITKYRKLKNCLKTSKLFNVLYEKLLTEKSEKKLTHEDRLNLKIIFQEDVKQLEELLSKKIYHWKDFN